MPDAAFSLVKQYFVPRTTVTVLPRIPDAVPSEEAMPFKAIGKILAGGPAAVRVTLLSCVAVALILKTAVTVHP